MERRPQLFLQDVVSEIDKVKWIVLFIAYLGEQGVRGSRNVGNVLSGLKFHWKGNLVDAAFFESVVVKQAKKGTRLTTKEVREKAIADDERRLLPAFVQMMIAMRAQLWDQSGYDTLGLDMKGTYIAAAVSYDSGLRPSNVTLRNGPKAEDHCIRAEDFVFVVDLGSGAMTCLRGGEEIRAFLATSGMSAVSQVASVDFKVLTGKMHNSASFSREVRSIGRGSVFEVLLLEDLCEWMVISRVKGKDEFVTRYAPVMNTRKVVPRKALTDAVKAASERFGFPGAKFSAKSLRSGFASHMTSCGISREDMVARAGWSLRSRVPEQHYINSFSRGAYGAALDPEGNVAGLGVAGTWRMMGSRGILTQR